jgi:hypothetical protein
MPLLSQTILRLVYTFYKSSTISQLDHYLISCHCWIPKAKSTKPIIGQILMPLLSQTILRGGVKSRIRFPLTPTNFRSVSAWPTLPACWYHAKRNISGKYIHGNGECIHCFTLKTSLHIWQKCSDFTTKPLFILLSLLDTKGQVNKTYYWANFNASSFAIHLKTSLHIRQKQSNFIAKSLFILLPLLDTKG